MANVKISQLPIGVPTSTSIFPFVDGVTTYQGAISALTSNSTVEVTYDELYSLINYTNYYTLLLKDNLNNHIINSFFGIIIGNFSYKIEYLRFTSFLIFLSGIFLINKRFKSKLTIILILLFFIFGNNFFVYSFLSIHNSKNLKKK